MVNIRNKIVMKSLNKLISYEKNNKNHPEEQISLLIQNIDRFGFTTPFLISKDNVIIAGHGRKIACERMNIDKVPCVVIDDLSEDEMKSLRISDNRIGELGEINWEFLQEEYLNLKESNSGLEFLTGYSDEDFEFIEEETQKIEEDDFEPAEDIETEIEKGDIIQLGNHRLMCGDSTDEEDVRNLMNKKKADMVFTDPPYGIDYSGGRTQVVNNKNYGKLKNDDLKSRALGNLICNIFEFDAKEIYICVSPIMQTPFLNFIEDSGKMINAVIVWDKKQPGLGYMPYRRQCEFILYIREIPFKKDDKQDFDLWSISRDSGQNYVHGTQKPLGVPGRAIKNSSKQGEIVLDLFGGSGSTLMACEQLNRVCFMMEYEPHYCEVICKRWEKLTGQTRKYLNKNEKNS